MKGRKRVEINGNWHWIKTKSYEQHGTRSAYVNAGCRCDECVKANRDYQRKWSESHPRYDRMTTPADKTPPHGSLARYQKRGCRCKLCKRASADTRWNHRQSQRQLNALESA